VVWNQTLQTREELYRSERRNLTYGQASTHLTTLKRQPVFRFLNEVSSVPLQQCLRHQQDAYAAFFAMRSRHPRRKYRHGRQAAEFTRSGFKWEQGRLTLAKMKAPLDLRWSRPLPAGAVPSTVTVSRDAAGRWHVSLLVEDLTVMVLPQAPSEVGVDLGLKDFAVLSSGERIPHPKHYQRRLATLARLQRRLGRKRKGSANRRKARAKVAKAHARVADARRDFLHQLSTDLIRRFQLIVVEDLGISGLVRNRRLAQSIATSDWSEFVGQLGYKAEWYGRTAVQADRFYPSSKTCSACGHKLDHLDLGTRTWTCPGCGTRHDRDHNAAKNLLAAGRAVHVCGAGVRPEHGMIRVGRSAMKQKSLVVRPGILLF
jgi:putative transposase